MAVQGALWCLAALCGTPGALYPAGATTGGGVAAIRQCASRDAGAGDLRASDFGDHPPPSRICHPLDGRKEIRRFQKKSKDKISRNLEPRSMSAFGGKADVIQGVAECPLIAKRRSSPGSKSGIIEGSNRPKAAPSAPRLPFSSLSADIASTR